MAKKSRQARILECLQAREDGKAAYARSDALLEELVKEMEPGVPVTLADGRTVALVDQFASKSVVWKPAGVRRFELKELR